MLRVTYEGVDGLIIGWMASLKVGMEEGAGGLEANKVEAGEANKH